MFIYIHVYVCSFHLSFISHGERWHCYQNFIFTIFLICKFICRPSAYLRLLRCPRFFIFWDNKRRSIPQNGGVFCGTVFSERLFSKKWRILYHYQVNILDKNSSFLLSNKGFPCRNQKTIFHFDSFRCHVNRVRNGDGKFRIHKWQINRGWKTNAITSINKAGDYSWSFIYLFHSYFFCKTCLLNLSLDQFVSFKEFFM